MARCHGESQPQNQSRWKYGVSSPLTKETIRRQYDEDIQLRAALRRLRDQSDRVRSLTEEVFWLRIALDGAKAGRGRYDRDKLYDKPRKDIWLRPLRKDWKRALNR